MFQKQLFACLLVGDLSPVKNFQKQKNLCLTVKRKQPFKPVITDQQSVEVVSSFKYLGTVVDSKLGFSDDVVYLPKKAQQRWYLLGSSSVLE